MLTLFIFPIDLRMLFMQVSLGPVQIPSTSLCASFNFTKKILFIQDYQRFQKNKTM